jgi:hypothetical protein
MLECQADGVQGNTRDAALAGFFGLILAITHDWMAGSSELSTDLILQPGDQRHPHQHCVSQRLFNEVVEFGAGSSRSALSAKFLVHSLSPKIVDQRSTFLFQSSADDHQVFPGRNVREKLLHKNVAVAWRFGEKQNSRSKSIDAMHSKSALPLPPKILGYQRPSRLLPRLGHGHCQEAGRLVDGYDGAILVEDCQALLGITRVVSRTRHPR